MASEFANKCAYDCIQVHGGSGYMKEYPCERLYRDARILTIYEGTSQLQVVASAKGISTVTYTALTAEYDMRIYAALPHSPLNGILAPIIEAFNIGETRYEALRAKAAAAGTTDHHLRTLAEQTTYLIMGRLLILDCLRDSRFLPSCRYITSCASLS